MAYAFLMVHTCFSLPVLKKIKHTAHMCGGIKTSKHNARTTLQLAHHNCTNLTQAKCTQMVVTARFKIQVFVTFSDT